MGCSSSRSQPGSEPEPEPEPEPLHHSTTTHVHVHVPTHDPALHSTQDHTHAHAHAHGHAHGHGQRLRQRERRRVVSYETPPHTCYPPVNTDIPNTIYIQQNDEEVITSIEDDYCPIGAPGKLVIALKITTTMMPFCSLSISGDVMGINSDFVNRNNYFYLIATNERHQLITVFEITYSDMISDSGSFYYELNSGHYLLEQIGVGDEVGLYVVKSPFWEPTDVACCRCSGACITIVTSESNLQNNAVENMMENPLANSDISDEQKWISFVQLTEDVIELLQATFRTSEVIILYLYFLYFCYIFTQSVECMCDYRIARGLLLDRCLVMTRVRFRCSDYLQWKLMIYTMQLWIGFLQKDWKMIPTKLMHPLERSVCNLLFQFAVLCLATQNMWKLPTPILVKHKIYRSPLRKGSNLRSTSIAVFVLWCVFLLY